MANITQILSAVQLGEPTAAAALLPLVYEELRKLAAIRMAAENPGHSLNATALVHEAYLRLVTPGGVDHWKSRGHFFAAAAEAMRRILVEGARRKKSIKHGGMLSRVDLSEVESPSNQQDEDLIELDRALTQFAQIDPQAAKLVELRYFTGLSVSEAAETLGISPRTSDRIWAYARAWLFREMTAANGSATKTNDSH